MLIDDSIVRGTTISVVVDLLRQAGATEVHVRVAAPPFRYPCYFGVDVDSRERLIANSYTTEEINNIIGADSLAYLSIEAVKKIAPTRSRAFCVGCFTGQYPVPTPQVLPKSRFETGISAQQKEE